jgi:serine/threonine protein kinase
MSFFLDQDCRILLNKEAHTVIKTCLCENTYEIEMKCLKMLRGHPRITNVYYSSKEDRQIFLPYYEMGDLFKWIHSKKATPETVKLISVQLAEGLQFMYGKGIIHADFKSGNIMLYQGDTIQVKIIDFGNSVCVDDDLSLVIYDDEEQQRCTTVNCPFPVLYERKMEASNFDMWSFVCVLHELYTRDMPFKSNNSTIPIISKSIRQIASKPIDRSISDDTIRVLHRMFAVLGVPPFPSIFRVVNSWVDHNAVLFNYPLIKEGEMFKKFRPRVEIEHLIPDEIVTVMERVFVYSDCTLSWESLIEILKSV